MIIMIEQEKGTEVLNSSVEMIIINKSDGKAGWIEWAIMVRNGQLTKCLVRERP